DILHTFCSSPVCPDGAEPGDAAGVLLDSSGSFFGTTLLGGKYGQGVAYEFFVKNGNLKNKIIHDFCTQGVGCQGQGVFQPNSNLIVDTNRNFYGTASGGANDNGQGVVYELI